MSKKYYTTYSDTKLLKTWISNLEYWMAHNAKISDFLDIKYNQGRLEAYKTILPWLEKRDEKDKQTLKDLIVLKDAIAVIDNVLHPARVHDGTKEL